MQTPAGLRHVLQEFIELYQAGDEAARSNFRLQLKILQRPFTEIDQAKEEDGRAGCGDEAVAESIALSKEGADT